MALLGQEAAGFSIIAADEPFYQAFQSTVPLNGQKGSVAPGPQSVLSALSQALCVGF